MNLNGTFTPLSKVFNFSRTPRDHRKRFTSKDSKNLVMEITLKKKSSLYTLIPLNFLFFVTKVHKNLFCAEILFCYNYV